jgi:putative membrane protein
VLYTCCFMALSGVVLFIADRLGLGRAKGKGVGGAIGQTTPPLAAILIMAFA